MPEFLWDLSYKLIQAASVASLAVRGAEASAGRWGGGRRSQEERDGRRGRRLGGGARRVRRRDFGGQNVFKHLCFISQSGEVVQTA